MKRLFFFCLAMIGASPAWAFGHQGAPAGSSWIATLWLEIECMFTTTWLVLGFIVRGEWFMLSNLEGICTTTTNQLFFADPIVAVATIFVLTILMITALFLAIRWAVERANRSTPLRLTA